ncbi:MAG: hypothetical protein ACYC7E_22735 [Armatimonadota bacterium]
MANWIALHDDVFGHRKTRKMSRILGIPCVYVVGHLASFWAWGRDKADNQGRLQNVTAQDIAGAAEWDGEPDQFFTALTSVGYLDIDADGTPAIHDFNEYNQRIIEKREYEAEKKRQQRERRKTGDAGGQTGDAGGQTGDAGGQTGDEHLDRQTDRQTDSISIHGDRQVNDTLPPTPSDSPSAPEEISEKGAPPTPQRTKRLRLVALEQHLSAVYKSRLFPLSTGATLLDQMEGILEEIERYLAIVEPGTKWEKAVADRLRVKAADLADHGGYVHRVVFDALGWLANDLRGKVARASGHGNGEATRSTTSPDEPPIHLNETPDPIALEIIEMERQAGMYKNSRPHAKGEK